MPIIVVRCNAEVTCICPNCFQIRQENALKKYSKQSFKACQEEILALLRFRPYTWFSITDLVQFLKMDRVVVTKSVNLLVEKKRLSCEFRYQGLDGRKVRCYCYVAIEASIES